MTSINPYFSWKRHVLALMGQSGHRMDLGRPMLTAHEQRVMEYYWKAGMSPEDFTEWLTYGTASEKLP